MSADYIVLFVFSFFVICGTLGLLGVVREMFRKDRK
jgi:hypothetical protein